MNISAEGVDYTEHGEKVRKLLQNVDTGLLRRDSNNTIEAVQNNVDHGLVAVCFIAKDLCGENAENLVKMNSVSFSSSRHLLSENVESRALQISASISGAVSAFSFAAKAIVMAIVQIMFLLMTTPVVVVVEILNIIVDTLNTLLSLSKHEQDFATGLAQNMLQSIDVWKDIVGLELEDDENRKRKLRRVFEDNNEEDALEKSISLGSKREYLATIVQFSAHGYTVGGGNTLTSVQFASYAYALFPDVKG